MGFRRPKELFLDPPSAGKRNPIHRETTAPPAVPFDIGTRRSFEDDAKLFPKPWGFPLNRVAASRKDALAAGDMTYAVVHLAVRQFSKWLLVPLRAGGRASVDERTRQGSLTSG
jgi:hypothetical protein